MTGCSTGIGRAVASRLARGGYAVVATARRVEDLRDLVADGDRGAGGLSVARLDVTDEVSVRECVAEVEARHGAVWGLVNNAGYALPGPLEDIPLDEARHQFEVNVLGPLLVAQAVLPGMRAAGEGRIVNVSSVAGRFSLPGGGCYHASKHALTSLSATLGLETRSFGVRVSTIEPAAVRTAFIETALNVLSRGGRRLPVYDAYRKRLETFYGRVRSRPRRYGVGSAQAVARAVEHALTSRGPRSRYVVGPAARLSLGLHGLLPGPWFDALACAVFPVPRPEGE
ncbi:SDR family oxidoreductase [Streptomyces sp. CA-181903]|uniref:SDR family oxidoreductase n=1 Tax=Streptomyces sp. CA-181903 TaxID=3240055 RepID=UPI003D913F62